MIGVTIAGLGFVLLGPLVAIGIFFIVAALVLFWRWMVAEGWTGRDPKWRYDNYYPPFRSPEMPMMEEEIVGWVEVGGERYQVRELRLPKKRYHNPLDNG